MRRKNSTAKNLTLIFLLFVLISSSTIILPISSATLFADGFETGNFSAWTSTLVSSGNSLTVETNNPHHGTYNARADGTSASSYSLSYRAVASAGICYVRGYFKITTLPDSTGDILSLIDVLYNDWQNKVSVVVGWDGSKAAWGLYTSTGGVENTYYYGSGPTADTYYCVEVLRDVTNQDTKLWINGVLVAERLSEAHSGNTNGVYCGLTWQAIMTSTTVYYDCVVIADAYIGPETPPVTPPTYSNIFINTSRAGENCEFSAKWTDSDGLDTCLFSTNITGTWENTTIPVSGTVSWANTTLTLPSDLGVAVGYRWYCNDTLGNMGDTDVQTLTTSGDWQYYKKLLFNNSAITENLINFPVLINLTRAGSDFWSHVDSSYDDLRFVDSDNVADLYFEVEYWDHAGQEALVWVKVPQIDANSATDFIYLYYGNTAPAASPYHNPSQVWNSNFVMVHHLEETTGTVTDSTSNGNDGTYNGALQDSEGQIDGADGFDGDYDYILISHDESLNFGTGPFTISVWVNYNGNNDDSDILRKGHTSPEPTAISNYKLELVDNHLSGVLYEDGISNSAVTTSGTYNDGNWHHVVFLRSGTNIYLYVDGVLQGSAGGATHDFSPAKNSASMTIGCKDPPDLEDFFTGIIDEVQVSNTARSEAWIEASYLSTNDEYVTFGSEEVPGQIVLTVTSPQEITYYSTTVALEGSTDLEADITYSLDGQANVTVAEETTSFSTSLTGLSYSSHSVTVYAVESADESNVDSETVYFTVEEPDAWACPDCMYRVKLTFDNSGSGENLVDFPVLVVLNPSRIDYGKTSATDIRFYDGATLLSKDTELWNPSGNSYIWVKVPQVDNTDTDYIYAYYGCTGAANLDDAASVWNGYAMVHHLEETSGTVTDSTSNGNDGTYNGALQDSEGKIDGANGFDGDYDYVTIPHDTTLNLGTGPFTISAWVKYSNGNDDSDILRKGCTTTAIANYKLELVSNHISGVLNEVGKSNSVVTTSGTYSDGNWHYVAFLRSGTNIYLYVDGTLQASAGGATHDFSDLKNTANLAIGSKDTLVEDFFDGIIDEVRIINIARSEAWIQASHSSMNDELVTYGSEEMQGQAPPNQPINPDPTDGDLQVPISITLSVDVSDPDGDPMDVSFYQTGPLPEDFTIIVLPDTQHYSESYPDIFDSQTEWIVDNIGSMNIIFVTHEGDIVDNVGVITEWQRANHSMSILDGYVPWAVLPGNHDMSGSDLTNYNTYFPESRFSGESWYGGAYGTNANNFQLFSGGEDDYLIFHFQYEPSDTVLAWANETIELYPNRRVIITTHSFLELDGSREATGQNMWDKFIKWHDDQIFLVLCGHNHGEASRTDTGTHGNTVYQLLADYQDYSNGGNGWLRILEFHPSEDEIYVKTYSPYLNQYETDSNSEFTLNYDMTSTTQPPTLIGTDTNVPSGTTASVTWTGLDYSTTYYWYAIADDSIAGTTQSETWTFTTIAGFSLSLSAGWNMVSFPVIPDDTSFASIFSGVSYYQVVTWTGTSYVSPSDVEAGVGYWVLVLSATELTVEGTAVESYEVDLPAGWSMIGGIYDVTVNAGDVFPDYYQLVTWSGTSYVTATTIEPGKGYWALVLETTHIVVEE